VRTLPSKFIFEKMIQRKQTIWLFLAAIIALLTFFIPYGMHTASATETIAITETNLNAKTTTLLAILSVLISVIAFGAIMLFKNRPLQMKVSILGMLICLAAIGYIIYDTNMAQNGNKLVIGLVGDKLYFGILKCIANMVVINPLRRL
jgi:hypothetical protein